MRRVKSGTHCRALIVGVTGLGLVFSPTSSVGAQSLSTPQSLRPFGGAHYVGEGQWVASGRLTHGVPGIYVTTLRLPDSTNRVGVAWLNTSLLSAKLYSGSLSPGGRFWHYTAPIQRAAAQTLVGAFNGGFLLNASNGGYLSEGHRVAPLRVGAASLVIYRDGSMTVGQWGRDVRSSPSVVAVRQNLNLLVDGGQPVAGLVASDISKWGAALHAVTNTLRSGIGLTKSGALVYVAGPMTIVDLAKVLVRARAVRAMTLDMNPLWPIFATYSPASPTGYASAGNGKVLIDSMQQTAGRFFQLAYSRDFVTLSVR